MSELMNAQGRDGNIRRNLLANASMLALLGYLGASAVALPARADEDRPIIWMELGGQFERNDTATSVYSPPFLTQSAADIATPMIDAQQPSKYSIGGNGKISFTPHDSRWVFSASVRYGRSNGARELHKQTEHVSVPQTVFGKPATSYGVPKDRFGDGQTAYNESHFILDFRAGKDVGLGMFGSGGSSVISAGTRFAQFTSSADVTLLARPIYKSGPFYTATIYDGQPRFKFHGQNFQNDRANMQAKHSTTAIGPSLSWDASVPVARGAIDSELTFDWGANAAILFGRQRAHVHQMTKDAYYRGFGFSNYRVAGYTNLPPDQNRARTVTIPNIGGFAGASFRYLDAKISFGYRADIFFNAMDVGIDTRKSSTVGFYGPFASIGIGLGG